MVRFTLNLNDENHAELLSIQIRVLKQEGKTPSMSKIINDLVEEGIKARKKKKEEKCCQT